MGLAKLNERVKDPTLQEAFDGLFPRDNPRDTRWAREFSEVAFMHDIQMLTCLISKMLFLLTLN